MGGTTSTNTTVQQSSIPGWVEDASKSNYNSAVDISGRPFEQYGGTRVAPTSGATQAAYNMFDRDTKAGNPAWDQSAGIFQDIANTRINPGTVTPGSVDWGSDIRSGRVNAGGDVAAGMLRDTDLSPYMNPWTNDVIDASLGDIDRSRLMQLNSNAGAAKGAKAFGGTRSAIVDSLTNSEALRESGILASGLRSAGYDRAVAGATGDINRQLETDIYNRNTNIAVDSGNVDRDLNTSIFNKTGRIGVDTGNVTRQLGADQFNTSNNLQARLAELSAMQSAAAGLSGIGDRRQGAMNDNVAGALAIGQSQQAQAQRELDAERQKFEEGRNYDRDGLQLRLSALGMSPYPTTQTNTSTETKPFDWATAGMGALSIFSGLSDDDSKTDKKFLGKDPDTGLDMYAYRYKGDPKTYPKVVGPMASDVEKKRPDAMGKTIGGYKTVNYGVLAGAR